MKKEIIYIATPIILCLTGILFKSIFLSDTLSDTQQILDISNDLSAKFYKDSLVQNNVQDIKKLYEINKRDSRSYGEVIFDLLNSVEKMLQKSGIEYKANEINQDFDEVKNFKAGTTSFYIILNISSSYPKIRNLLQLIEQSEHVINIESIEIIRGKLEKDSKNQAAGNIDDDEYNKSVPIIMKARLEFVKFL